ncbi:expressed unknown protein [Seminavis robusta]|uniref:Uncharacterized protein n=1 Tax=Seminavis robusta TaxID=568900 RepID=A0A9N8EAA5_9STRA|nr:expressed unknown protein [Seminavis robusta]|eukprot:Sro720_g192480.1 n/a (160) ;mRNA; f:3404-4435
MHADSKNRGTRDDDLNVSFDEYDMVDAPTSESISFDDPEISKSEGKEFSMSTEQFVKVFIMAHSLKTAVRTIGVAGGVAAAGAGMLSLAGFGMAGIAASSMAAAWQSSIGNVAAGSIFAALQSAGATGAIASVFGFGATAATGVVAFFGLHHVFGRRGG